MTLAEDHADDAAQVVLMRVFARASEFQAGRPVLPWFYAIAANELHGARRRNAVHSSRQTEEAVGLHLAHEADPERSLLEAELRRCLEQALASLDESSADAIRFMLDGRRPERGAPAFRKRVSRAYAKLRLLLGGLYGR
jgi:RNA polymerase sigma-70 factor (ECF subfamily)